MTHVEERWNEFLSSVLYSVDPESFMFNIEKNTIYKKCILESNTHH